MSGTQNPQWSAPDELGYIRENGKPILRLLGGMNDPEVIARGQFLLTAANTHDDLVAALKRFTDEERGAGWRGGAYDGATADLFACEYCKQTHLDFRQIAHTDNCPVTEARNALAKAGEAR